MRRRKGHRHPPAPAGSLPLPGELFVGAIEAYRTWADRRKKLHPAGDARRAPIAQLVVDVDDLRELVPLIETGINEGYNAAKRIPHAYELFEFLRFVLGELEAHEAAKS